MLIDTLDFDCRYAIDHNFVRHLYLHMPSIPLNRSHHGTCQYQIVNGQRRARLHLRRFSAANLTACD
jgi:hypothetical protein